MKISISSDWHLHNWKDSFSKENERLENQLQAIRCQFEHAHKNNIRVIVVAGDFVQMHKNTPIKVTLSLLTLLKEMFYKYPDIEMYGITGNHDNYEKCVLINYDKLSSWPRILHKMFRPRFNCMDGGYYNLSVGDSFITIMGIPYMDYKEDYTKVLNKMAEVCKRVGNYRKILFIHQTPNFLNMNMPMDTDPNDSIYDCWDQVFCGHIHKRMQLTDKFTTIGTMVQLGFGEGGKDVDNGFLVYDSETNTKEWVNLDFPKFVEVKEGEDHPNNCYVRELPTFKHSTSMKPSQRKHYTTNNRAEMVKSYVDEVGGSKLSLNVGLEIIQGLIENN